MAFGREQQHMVTPERNGFVIIREGARSGRFTGQENIYIRSHRVSMEKIPRQACRAVGPPGAML